MSGLELFWSSGTWWFFVGQLAIVVLVVYLYISQGREEEKAKEAAESRDEK